MDAHRQITKYEWSVVIWRRWASAMAHIHTHTITNTILKTQMVKKKKHTSLKNEMIYET